MSKIATERTDPHTYLTGSRTHPYVSLAPERTLMSHWLPNTHSCLTGSRTHAPPTCRDPGKAGRIPRDCVQAGGSPRRESWLLRALRPAI